MDGIFDRRIPRPILELVMSNRITEIDPPILISESEKYLDKETTYSSMDVIHGRGYPRTASINYEISDIQIRESVFQAIAKRIVRSLSFFRENSSGLRATHKISEGAKAR
jgi:hypothetical protein